MAVNLGTAYIRIAPRLDGVSNSIKSALLGGASSANGGIGSLLSGSVGQVAIGTALGGALLSGVKAVAGKITEAVSAIVSGATEQMDSVIRTKVALKQMGYSEQDVARNLDMLRKNANRTAADFGDLADGFLTLTSSWKNINLTADATRALSDAILSMGGTPEMVANAITQIGQVDLDGPLDGETWRSLRNSGLVPVLSTIAKMNGMSLAEYKEELSAKGELTTRHFVKALIDLDKQGSKTQNSLEDIAVSNAAATWAGSWEAAKENVVSSLAQTMESMWSASGLGQKIIDVGDKIGKAIPGVVDNIKTKVMAFLKESRLDTLLPKIGSFLGGIVNVLWQLLSVAITVSNAIWQTVLQPIYNAVMPIIEWVFGSLGVVFNTLATTIQTALEKATVFFANFAVGFKAGMAAIGDFCASVFNRIVGIFKGIKGWFQTIFQGAVNIIKVTFGPVIEFFRSIFESIKNVFAPVTEIGKNIVKGLWNGIKDMVGWIKSKIQQFGDDVLQGLKDFFGIKSPSKVMAEQGKYIAQGLGKGIADNAKYATEAIDDVSEQMMKGATGINPSLQMAMARTPYMGSQAQMQTQPQVVQNNTFNQVADNLDVKEASKLLGWQVATAI